MPLFAFLRSLALLGYSLLFACLKPALRIVAALSPRLRGQLAARPSVPELATALARARAPFQRAVVFFCSSAGEFEQARPLIERLRAERSVYVQVIFFSQSGLDFLKARGDDVPACLSPATDSVWQWGWLLSALRPNIVAIVRHEIWPGFLAVAQSFARVDLIDASRSLGEGSTYWKRWARSHLLKQFSNIYAVSDDDVAFFRKAYGLKRPRLVAVGDTKYDRARERAVAKAADIAVIKTRLEHMMPRGAKPKPALRLVIGSAYSQEIELLAAAQAEDASELAKWQIVLAPHHVTPEMLNLAKDRLARAGLAVGRFSQNSPGQVVLLDSMGVLAEVYGTADAALVGGALHRQVHNVLEPACHGLALAYGPFYKNSQEAIHLVQAGLAQVITQPGEFLDWLRTISTGASRQRQEMVAAVTKLAGASDRIMADWRGALEGQMPDDR